MASQGYRHYAGTKGSKCIYVGADLNIYNYNNLADAVEAAQNYDTIFVEPGTYTLTETLLINKPISIKALAGINSVIITSALTTRTINLINPVTGPAAATYNKFEGIKIMNTSTGDAIEIDNDGGIAQDMMVEFADCSIINSGGGLAIDLDHTTETKDIFLYVHGQKAFNSISASDFGIEKAGSVVLIDNMYCTGAFALGAVNVAWIFNMVHCLYASEAQTTGGSASLITNQVGNIYGASGFAAAVTAGDAGDFDATAAAEYFATYA
jgi:hypothetical protein